MTIPEDVPVGGNTYVGGTNHFLPNNNPLQLRAVHNPYIIADTGRAADAGNNGDNGNDNDVNNDTADDEPTLEEYNGYFTGLVDEALISAQKQATAETVNTIAICMEKAAESAAVVEMDKSLEIVGSGSSSSSSGKSDDASPSSAKDQVLSALMPDDVKRHLASFMTPTPEYLTQATLTAITKRRREKDTKAVEDWVDKATQKVLAKCKTEAEQGYKFLEILDRHAFDDLVGGRARANYHSWGNDELDIYTNGVTLVAKKLKSLGFTNIKYEYSRGTTWPHTGCLRVEWPLE